MKGKVEFRLNEETMKVALKHYFETKVLQAYDNEFDIESVASHFEGGVKHFCVDVVFHDKVEDAA